MNETLKLIADRYSCRNFSDKSIPEEDLRAIAQAAIQAPSAMNMQPCFFAVVTDGALLADLDEAGMTHIAALPDKTVYERMQSRGGRLLYNAPCAIIIALNAQPVNEYKKVDLGIAAENIVLAAASLGIASCHHGLTEFAFQGNKAAEFTKRMNFPEGYEFGLAVLLGYSDQSNAPHEPDQNKLAWI